MSRFNGWVAQVYGYAVCLICVVIILVSTKSVIDAAFDYSNPLAAGIEYGRFGTVSSYRVYRAEMRPPRGPDGRALPDTVNDAELRKAFLQERAEQIDSARYRALRSLVSSAIFLVLATALFLLHWRWVRRANAESAAS